MDIAAVVVARRLGRGEDNFRVRAYAVTLYEPGYFVFGNRTARPLGVVDVDIAVRIEIRVYGDTKQPALRAGADGIGDNRVRLEGAVCKEPYPACGLLRVKETPARVKRHRHRVFHA